MYLVTAAEMREMDHRTIDSFGIPGRVLMENAGRGATRVFMEKFYHRPGQKVGIMAGRGNNGGDGFVVARYLAQQGIPVAVYLLAEKTTVAGDAAANLALLPSLGIPLTEIPDETAFSEHCHTMERIDIWVDAILGTGLKSNVKGYFKRIIDFMNNSTKPVFAVDIPSGLNSDTGQPCGVCIKARATATFGFAKTGHLVYPGADYTGDLEIIDIGIPHSIAQTVNPKQFVLKEKNVRDLIMPRSADSHKGQTGHLLVIAGSPGKTGAAAMSAVSALRSGAGLVTLGIAESLNTVLETQVLEAMTHPLPETQAGILGPAASDLIMDLMADKNCLALGPGLGQAAETHEVVINIIKNSEIPLVIDADGLNILSANVPVLHECKAPVILTPHPGEMTRLLNTTVVNVQQDRIAAARNFAQRYGVHMVLKGAGTVIALPDGNVYINTTGNAGMASGGMGDVLTGVIAGLICQGYSAAEAARLGVYLHGAAADTLAEKIGPVGYLASEVMNSIPQEIGKLLKDS